MTAGDEVRGRILAPGLVLAPLERRHIEQVRLIRNDDRIRPWFRYSGIVEPEDQERWYDDYSAADDDRMWVLVDDEDRVLGAAALYSIDREVGDAEFGRLMAHPDLGRGRGLGRLLTAALLDEAAALGLRHVRLVVKKDNAAARSIYESVGYVVAQASCEPDEIAMIATVTRP